MRSREEIINDSKHLGVQELSKLILEVLLDIRDLYGQRQKDVWPGIANIPPSELLEAFAKMRDQKRRVKTPEESARARWRSLECLETPKSKLYRCFH